MGPSPKKKRGCGGGGGKGSPPHGQLPEGRKKKGKGDTTQKNSLIRLSFNRGLEGEKGRARKHSLLTSLLAAQGGGEKGKRRLKAFHHYLE